METSKTPVLSNTVPHQNPILAVKGVEPGPKLGVSLVLGRKTLPPDLFWGPFQL